MIEQGAIIESMNTDKSANVSFNLTMVSQMWSCFFGNHMLTEMKSGVEALCNYEICFTGKYTSPWLQKEIFELRFKRMLVARVSDLYSIGLSPELGNKQLLQNCYKIVQLKGKPIDQYNCTMKENNISRLGNHITGSHSQSEFIDFYFFVDDYYYMALIYCFQVAWLKRR